MPRCGTRARMAAAGLAVPMSRPRYTWRASAEMTVMGCNAASAAATAVLPTPVGPTMTGTSRRSAAPKPPLQLDAGQLYVGGPPVLVLRRQPRGHQAHHE